MKVNHAEITEILDKVGVSCPAFNLKMLPEGCTIVQSSTKGQRLREHSGRNKGEYLSNYDPCLGCEHDTRNGGHKDKKVKVIGWKRLDYTRGHQGKKIG